jgi:hypothetical protein
MVKLMPKAKPSSRPLNHLARAQVMATIRGSEPSPRRNRAATMTQKSDVITIRIPANVQMAPKRMVDLTVPYLSMTTPPSNRTMTAARL